MSKHKNQKIQCRTHKEYSSLLEEIVDYLGRDVNTDEANLEITVLALPRHYKKKSVRESRLRRARQNRSGYNAEDEDYSGYADKYSRR